MRRPLFTFVLGMPLVLALVGIADEKTAPKATTPATSPTTKQADQEPYESITEKDIAAIVFDDLPPDQGFISPVAEGLDNLDDVSRKRLEDLQAALDEWGPGMDKSVAQRVRYWMSLCCIPDLGRAEFESELPYTVFERMKAEIPAYKLKKSLAWIILKPNDGKVVNKCVEIDAPDPIDEELIRERHVIFAKKLLGRILGKLPEKG